MKNSDLIPVLNGFLARCHELTNCLRENRQFDAGFCLAKLCESLNEKISNLKEEEDDEEEDDEVEVSKSYYEEKYEETWNELIDQRRLNIELREQNIKSKEKLQDFIILIRRLFNEDKIFPDEREEVRQELLKNDLKDGLYGRIA